MPSQVTAKPIEVSLDIASNSGRGIRVDTQGGDQKPVNVIGKSCFY